VFGGGNTGNGNAVFTKSCVMTPEISILSMNVYGKML